MGNLVIVEVSQKQAYIFASNKLSHNISKSDIIAYVTDSRYFKKVAGDCYRQEENEVYSGGGHAILQFASEEAGRKFIHAITLDARKNFPGLELFATLYHFDGEPDAERIFELMKKLEVKKSLRRGSFLHKSFGVEKEDENTKNVEVQTVNGEVPRNKAPESEVDQKSYPDGYARAMEFENLGGSKGLSNFIAVVHIDGNAMGKRVEELRKEHTNDNWDQYRNVLKEFSDCIDRHFKDTFVEMCQVVAENNKAGLLESLGLRLDSNRHEMYFPVRRVITEGDDICFVTEGRIGIECARIYLEHLTKKVNTADQRGYAAAAGVAIVHQKYPFYRAYDMAEKLCSNAKKYIANSTEDVDGADASNVCTIDWHIEFGELDDDVEEVRRKYATSDGKRMELRPYVVCGPREYMEREKARQYSNFRQIMKGFLDQKVDYARGKIKQLRGYIREGEIAVKNYLHANLLEDLILECYQGIYEMPDLSLVGRGSRQKRENFITTTDGESRSILFDAVEAMDTFVLLQDEEGEI